MQHIYRLIARLALRPPRLSKPVEAWLPTAGKRLLIKQSDGAGYGGCRRGRGALADAGSDGVTLFDALDKQLGLKLELKPTPPHSNSECRK